MWEKTGSIRDWEVGERFWHAGLSPDGKMCFLATCEDEAYAVIALPSLEILWKDEPVPDDQDPDHGDLLPRIEDWVDDHGWIDFKRGNIETRFRIFGLLENHPNTSDYDSKTWIDIDVGRHQIAINNSGEQGEPMQEIHQFEADSGDWAHASIAPDGQTIAVLEPHHATFFRRTQT